MRRTRTTRNKVRNFPSSLDVQDWLQSHPEALISCPNQPGNLKLMPAACAKRHRAANEPRWAVIGAEPFHLFVFKMNLVPCRNCKIGARLAAQHREKAA
jgi:hypothetical protein